MNRSTVRRYARSLLALAAVAALPASVRAESDAGAQNSGAFSDVRMIDFDGAPVTLDAAGSSNTAPRRPLMQLMDSVGAGSMLDDAKIRLWGHVEGSYNYNFNNLKNVSGFAQNGQANSLHQFDFPANRGLLNQVELAAERPVSFFTHQWDVGFRIRAMYGTDVNYIVSHGMDFGQDTAAEGFHHLTALYFDLPESYVDIMTPVGNGLRLRIGRFYGFYGGTIEPEDTTLFSHSFFFDLGGQTNGFIQTKPYTLTGILATYPLNDRVIVDLGVDRGWDQSLSDKSHSVDAIGRITVLPDDKTRVAFAFSTGNEAVRGNGEEHMPRTLLDLVVSRQINDRLTLAANLDWETQAFSGLPSNTLTDVAVYATYKINKYVTAAGRAEWLRLDQGEGFKAFDLYEFTVGCTVTPFPDDRIMSNLVIRPEFRYDHANFDTAFFSSHTNLATGGGVKDQTLFEIDAIFKL